MVRVATPTASPPAAAPAAPRNSTGLTLEPVATPISEASAHFVTPGWGDRLALADAARYEVHWVSERLEPDALGVDIALDAQRPRRLPRAESMIPLGQLLAAGEQLSLGEHWLFAAPISATGVVPKRAEGAPPSAVAVRFWVGDAPQVPPPATGVVWLRKPEGTYNGAKAEHVLFDAQAFGANGAPLALPCALQLRGKASGEVAFPAPFSAVTLASGDYEISASAPGVAAAAVRSVTVNQELDKPK